MTRIAYIDKHPEDRTEHYEFFRYMFETHGRYMQRVISEFYLPDIVYGCKDFKIVVHDFEVQKADFFIVFNRDTNMSLPDKLPVLLIITVEQVGFTTPNIHVISEKDFFECIKDHLKSMRFPYWHNFLLKRVHDYCDKAIAQLSLSPTQYITSKTQTDGQK